MNVNKWIKPLVRACMCFFGILGNNWLAFRSLPKSRSRLRTNDILFVNLAVSNLITNYLVDLPDTLDFAVHWTAAGRYCAGFNFCSDISETSSIFTTMFITMYWHQKLVGSLKHGGAPVQMDNLRLITALLTGSWAFATVFSIPHFFFSSTGILNQSSDDCMEQFSTQEARQTYEMLYLTLANLAPIIGIVFASIQIAVTLVQNERRIKKNTNVFTRGGNAKMKTQEPTSKDITSNAANSVQDQRQGVQRSQDKTRSSSGNQVRAAKSVVTVATVFVICWLTHLMLSITITVYESIVVADIISYIGATYTCIIPYMYLHGMKKLNCSSKG
ncbi:C-C chemokine receptor type 7 [Pangasianodon hypophthalmus]|uniref:C-C chemokine receptor type 7 n=1 Tax=Pangasianodon hypophthalmus TaxID=310915 RepID=UPI000EFDF884|nr:C-C chemokine receptor type 7 [Pangasianodon hypophthalmus]